MNFDTSTLKTEISRITALILILALPIAIAACDSQLEQETFGQIAPESFFNNEEEFVSAVSAAYSPLRGFIFNPFDLVEHSADQIMVPTRGPDWGDGGQWRQLTQHEWNADHPFLNGNWSQFQTGISRTNGLLSSLAESQALSEEAKTQFAAEVRFLRSFYYYWLMDLFGNVPIVLENGSELDFPQQPVSSDDPPPQNTRKEVYDFLLQELTGCTSDNFDVSCVDNPDGGSVLANLPSKAEVDYGRATRGAGYAFLARLLINSEIYSGSVTSNGVDTGSSLYEEASAAADVVLNAENGVGMYSLSDNYYDNFAADNHSSEEIIFAATFKAKDGLGYNKQQAVLHYNHPVPTTPWNGFTTIAEYYKSFDTEAGSDGEFGTNDDVYNDPRGSQFLVGKQYQEPSSGCAGAECFSNENSDPVVIRGGDPDNPEDQLDISLEIPSIELGGDAGDIEAPGARPMKFELDPNASQDLMGNDFPLFRVAEMWLIKAEAQNELGNIGEVESILETLRDARGADDDVTVSSQTEGRRLVLQERGFEFAWEIQRRQDLIRYEFAHGGQDTDDPYAPTFTGPWQFKDQSSGHRVLFPIPRQQLSVNPNLDQNPGY